MNFIQNLKEQLKKISPYPWVNKMLGGGKGKPNEHSIRIDNNDSSGESAIGLCYSTNGNAANNSKFIAQSPQNIEKIIELLEEAVKMAEFYKDQYNYIGNCPMPIGAEKDLNNNWDKGYKAQVFLKKIEGIK